MSRNDSLSRDDHLQIEAYRTHNQWNDHDGKNMMVLDVIVATVAAALLFRGPDILPTTMQKWIGTGLLVIMMVMWWGFYYKFSERMDFRYNKMRTIEGSLGFRCHKEIKTFISQHWLQRRRFLWARILLTLLVLGSVCVSLWFGKTCQ